MRELKEKTDRGQGKETRKQEDREETDTMIESRYREREENRGMREERREDGDLPT